MRYWKCLRYVSSKDPHSFTVGNVYTTDDNIEKITSDGGYLFDRSWDCQTVLEFLNRWYEFEEITNPEENQKVNKKRNLEKIVIISDGDYAMAEYSINGITQSSSSMALIGDSNIAYLTKILTDDLF